MKISMLQRLLSEQDPDAEVMVSVDMMLSRSEPRPGTLSLPTRALDVGTFQSGDMLGRPWVAIIACDAWGQSPSVSVVTPTEPCNDPCNVLDCRIHTSMPTVAACLCALETWNEGDTCPFCLGDTSSDDGHGGVWDGAGEEAGLTSCPLADLRCALDRAAAEKPREAVRRIANEAARAQRSSEVEVRPQNATKCLHHPDDQRWLGDRYETCGACALEMHQEIMMLKGYSPEGKRVDNPRTADARDVAFDEIRHIAGQSYHSHTAIRDRARVKEIRRSQMVRLHGKMVGTYAATLAALPATKRTRGDLEAGFSDGARAMMDQIVGNGDFTIVEDST